MLKNLALKHPVYINAIETISPLGKSSEEIWKNYRSSEHFFQQAEIGGKISWGGFLPKDIRKEVEKLRNDHSRYRNLDDSVLYAILAGRLLNLSPETKDSMGLNIGSSRGATGLFEKYHEEYLNSGRTSTYSSPSTTLGNISSWVAQDLQLEGPELSHSITCSTGMHAILNALAWIESGMASGFLAGASEAPLTGFTLAQMRAMKIYSEAESEFPCRSLDMNKKMNSMILSEAAGLLLMEREKIINTRAVIKGIGYGNEKLKHGASLSKKGKCLQKSMKMAIGEMNPGDVDAVVLHAPGTIGGDLSEVNAIKKIFGEEMPAITSNKWKVGHSFATSGILSLQMAVLMLENQQFIPVPFSEFDQEPDRLENILINSVGFGGNAVSLLIGKDS